jgi:hypothetical protein
MSVTGCRPGQLARLLVSDLDNNPLAPKLKMLKSGKGGTTDCAKRKAPRYYPNLNYRRDVIEVVKALGLDPKALYCLRHRCNRPVDQVGRPAARDLRHGRYFRAAN